MKNNYSLMTLEIVGVVILQAFFLAKTLEATPPVVPQNPIITVSWWGEWRERPARPKEKFIFPKREEDEWYKRRHEKEL